MFNKYTFNKLISKLSIIKLFKSYRVSSNSANTSNVNMFLRKSKIFNKSRYSRNRQYYRTGVYWCLWLNIIATFSLYYLFYRFTFKFSYLFLLMFSVFGLFFFNFFSRNYLSGLLNLIFKLFNFFTFFLYCKVSTLIFLIKGCLSYISGGNKSLFYL